MSDPLHDCRAKVDWAKTHRDTLEKEIRTFLDQNPYRFSGDFDIEGTKKVFVSIDPTVEMPRIRWGVMVGDCVHNARSALDQLAWRLAGADDADYWTQFPIFIDRDEFYKKGLGRIKNLCPHAQAIVEDLQPYQPEQSSEWRRRALWRLSQLDNADKHRLISVIVSGIPWSALRPTRSIAPTAWYLNPGPFEGGKEVGFVELPPHAPADTDVHVEFDVEIVLQEIPDMSATRVLSRIVVAVEGIIERFTDFF